MIYEIDGSQRAGKGVFGAALGHTLSETFKIPLVSTNNIKNSRVIRYYDDILALKNCVFVWDEIDNDLQSRNFQRNIEKKGLVIEWIKQCGKRDVILLMIVQYRFQMDKILRQHSNVIVWTEKHGNEATYQFINNETKQIMHKIGPIDMSPFFHLYDHKEFMSELDWREKPSYYKKKDTGQIPIFGQKL